MSKQFEISRKITERTYGIIAGSMALAIYYNHRIPSDIDVWNCYPDVLPFRLDNRRERSIWLTNGSVDGISIDIVKPGHPRDRNFFPPRIIDGIRVSDLRDLAGNMLEMITTRPVKKKTAFFDLFFLFKNFSLVEMIGLCTSMYNDVTEDQILSALIDFDSVEYQKDPVILCDCGATWEAVKVTILNAVANYE